MAITTRLYEEVQNNSEALVLAHLGMVKRVALHLKVRFTCLVSPLQCI